MKAICSKNRSHTKFRTTAHVVQTWVVDGDGNFLEEVSTDETVAGPNVDNEWTCAECGASAVVKG